MEEEKKKYNTKKGITIQGMASRIYNREDNVAYRYTIILDVLKMYFDECEKALINGEKVNLSTIGTLTPHVHTPLSHYNLANCNKDEGNPPYTNIKFTRHAKIKEKMNKKFLDNLEDGYAGLSEDCMCHYTQKGILIDSGFLKSDEGDSKCLEE